MAASRRRVCVANTARRDAVLLRERYGVAGATESAPNQTPDGKYQWRGRGGEARLYAVCRGVSASLLGNQPIPTVTVQVEEYARMRRPVLAGLVIVEAKGLRPAQAACSTQGHTNLYEANILIRGNGEAPGAVTIRYYSAASVARALKPYHFTFSGVTL